MFPLRSTIKRMRKEAGRVFIRLELFSGEFHTLLFLWAFLSFWKAMVDLATWAFGARFMIHTVSSVASCFDLNGIKWATHARLMLKLKGFSRDGGGGWRCLWVSQN